VSVGAGTPDLTLVAPTLEDGYVALMRQHATTPAAQ
jgi:hypothetical protein